MKRLGGRGKTVLLTTHYMDEAQYLADRVAVIAGGRIVAEGDPKSIGGRNSSAAVIRFALPAAVSISALPVSAKPEGARVAIEAPDLTRTLHVLTGWALEHGVDLEGLTVSRPSLEDVYLDLVGR